MRRLFIVSFAIINSTLSKESTTAESVECKSLVLYKSINSVVCAACSGNNWYVPGYGDRKVRTCDKCYKEWMAYKV
jgi:hypothetical protein